jgi:hypothetical protein
MAWLAIGLSALVFGLPHPGEDGAAVTRTAAGVATVVLTTGGVGVALGWLHRQHGLLAPVLLPPLLLPPLHHLR